MDSEANVDESLVIHDEIKSAFHQLPKFNKNYNIVITGPVSAGKSTLLTTLYNLLSVNQNVQTFPEFVTDSFGQEILKKMLLKELSVLTFQSYILDFWDKMPRYKNINLYERVLDDTVFVFCRYYLKHNKLSHDEYKVLEEKMHFINEIWSLPSYKCKDVEFHLMHDAPLNEELMQIYNIIKNDYNKSKTVIFGLDISPTIIKSRISKRGREGEDTYDDEYINTICEYYKDLYAHITN